MNQRTKNFKEELSGIERELNNPKVFSNPQKLKDLSKRRNELQEIIDKSFSLEELQKQFIENEELIAEEKDDSEEGRNFIKMVREENEVVRLNISKAEEELNLLLVPKDPNDEKNVIVEIRAGAGGDEASLFATELYRMYTHFAEKNSWKIAILNSNRNDIGGFKEVIFEVVGSDVYSKMKYESGVHRVQRIPETEKQGRVHTSTVTVAIIPEAEEVELEILPNELRIDTFASSGPGGQSVNTTDSAVRITHLPTGIVVSCQDQKSQARNKEKAMNVLRSRLLALKEEEERRKQGEERQMQIGTGDRSEKIRTYNFPQDRITDHRIKKSWSNLEGVLAGEIDDIVDSLKKEEIKKYLG